MWLPWLNKTRGEISRQGKIAANGRSEIPMNKDDIQLLFEYDRWANKSVLQAASTLSGEQFTRDLGGSFKSVRDTLVHIVSGEWGWLTIWKEPALTSAFVTELWDRIEVTFDPKAYCDIASVRAKWGEIEREQIDFVSGVTDESLMRMLPIRTTHLSLAHLMQHMANHSTYHRGQVSMMMRQLGGKPVATDFARFLLVGRSEAAHAR
jgi:uncharacterized damage-inducible protein DinB